MCIRDRPNIVRWLQGTHTASNRSPSAILKKLQPIVPTRLFRDMQRILLLGAPALCHGESTEENFQAFFDYGNHKSVYVDFDKTMKTMRKGAKRGYILVMGSQLLWYIPNVHTTPIGMVDLNHPYKNPRAVFDSSFRPLLDSMAINDMCQLENEPELHFPRAKQMFYWWLWNLRITYPNLEIYIADDDVSGAFRLVKYNPNLVALHSFVLGEWLFMNTGQTFGDMTSPPNWDPVAECRRLLARHLWKDPSIVARAAHFLPDGIEMAPPPPADIVASFPKLSSDALNPGVLDPSGNRIAPLFPHHVDDNCYADIAPFLGRTISASIVALYEILAYPNDSHFQDPLSRDKFNNLYTHLRKVLGLIVDSRSMTVTLPDYKFDRTVALIDEWRHRGTFTILDAAILVGQLIHATECCRWGRPLFFNLQNTLRHLILAEYTKVKALVRRRKLSLSSRQLPRSLAKRAEALISAVWPPWSSDRAVPLLFLPRFWRNSTSFAF